MKTKDGKKGGYLVGNPHSQGGIKAINTDTGEPLEVEGGEVVITKPAVKSKKTYEFEGRKMKPKEILSKINSDHGGVEFASDVFAKGGEIVTAEPFTEEVAMQDVRDTMLYEALLEAITEEEAKYIVMKSLVNHQSSPQKAIQVEKKLTELYELKAKYKLDAKTGFDILTDYEKALQADKETAGEPCGLPSINGKPSNLTLAQYEKVRTRDFIDWFGDWILAYELGDYSNVSCIIDAETMEPKILYHGTGTDFYQWSFSQFPAAYFADNRSYSEWFAAASGGNGFVYEVFISMRNPINMQHFGLDDVPLGEILDYLAQNYALTDRFAMVPYLSQLDEDELREALAFKMKIWHFVRRGVPFLNYIKDNTFFDGILMYENNPEDQVNGEDNTTGSHVVFYTTQIKWAEAVVFNADVMDNRFSRGGLIKSLKDKYMNLSLDF